MCKIYNYFESALLIYTFIFVANILSTKKLTIYSYNSESRLRYDKYRTVQHMQR